MQMMWLYLLSYAARVIEWVVESAMWQVSIGKQKELLFNMEIKDIRNASWWTGNKGQQQDIKYLGIFISKDSHNHLIIYVVIFDTFRQSKCFKNDDFAEAE